MIIAYLGLVIISTFISFFDYRVYVQEERERMRERSFFPVDGDVDFYVSEWGRRVDKFSSFRCKVLMRVACE
jgi:hypothetical protein